MIQAQDLPPARSVYNFPKVLPNQELTEEQEAQAQIAQIAGIVVAVAAGKKALRDYLTNQLVALLRVTDLTSEVAVKLFAKQAAALVKAGVAQAQTLTWQGVNARAKLVGVDFPATIREAEKVDSSLLYSRSSSLENAYARIAEEYAEYLSKPHNDPVIQSLVEEFESQGLTPKPRPDILSSDAVQRTVNGEQDWKEAFKEAKEAFKAQGGKEPKRAVSLKDKAKLIEKPGNAEFARQDEQDVLDSDILDAQSNREALEREDASPSDSEGEESSGYDSEETNNAVLVLNEDEIDAIVERYAEQKAEERAERMVSQDIAGASRNTHKIAMDNLPKTVVGYRRVVHPELSESGQSCGLCIVASTMRYTKRDLMPIHSGCNCETAEIYSVNGQEFDPGHQINMEDLGVFYSEAGGSTHGWDLKKQKYEIINHPEYGPTLTNISKKMENKEPVPFEGRIKEKNNG